MGIELINLSNETKAYLNNLRRAVEKQTQAIESLARKRPAAFVEFETSVGQVLVRADRVDCVVNECCEVTLAVNGNYGYHVKEPYREIVRKLNEALGNAAGAEGGVE